jgi:hypothetical protein
MVIVCYKYVSVLMLFARMLRSAAGRILCLCCLGHAFALAPVAAMADHKAANVLVIYSNGRLLPANVEGRPRPARRRSPGGPGPPPTCFDEFLDVPRFGGAAFQAKR